MKMNIKKATTKIRLNPSCFINLNGKSYGGIFETIKDGKNVKKEWKGKEVWVTPEYAAIAIRGDRPIARIVETKSSVEK